MGPESYDPENGEAKTWRVLEQFRKTRWITARARARVPSNGPKLRGKQSIDFVGTAK